MTQLIVKRPVDFLYKAGDYVFLKLPEIGIFSWHAFTITSCPEEKGTCVLFHCMTHFSFSFFNFLFLVSILIFSSSSFTSFTSSSSVFVEVLWFHIKAAGNWTRTLHTHYEQRFTATERWDDVSIQSDDLGTLTRNDFEDLRHQHIQSKSGCEKRIQNLPNLDSLVFLDGPYSASAVSLFDTEHAVLISAGIGVAPFAAVLGSALHYFRDRPIISGSQTKRTGKLKTLDFIWVVREHSSFEWFLELLHQCENEQLAGRGFVDLQLYVTSLPLTVRSKNWVGLRELLQSVIQQRIQNCPKKMTE